MYAFAHRGPGFGGWPGTGGDVGPLVRALWLVQRYGTADAVDPANDQRVKGAMFKALGKEGELTLSELGGFMEPETFKKLAGSDDRISPEEITQGGGNRRAGEPRAGCCPRSGSMPIRSRHRST